MANITISINIRTTIAAHGNFFNLAIASRRWLPVPTTPLA
jgi:hypothetical protein